jgi:hypothetical protein
VKKQGDFRAYLGALFEAPISIIFALLDLASVAAVIYWVVDDWREGLVVLAFVVVIHIGHYLIFRKQRGTIAELETRIVELENKQPRLSLLFKSNEEEWRQRCTVSVEPFPQQPDFDEMVQYESERLREDFEEEQHRSSGLPGGSISRLVRQLAFRKAKTREEYEAECQGYLEQVHNQQQLIYAHKLWNARLRSVGFRIENNGRAPATNVIVKIHFPDGFDFPSEEDHENMLDTAALNPLARPKPFKKGFEDLLPPQSIPLYDHITPALEGLLGSGPSDVSGPIIKREGSTEVDYEIKELLHGLPIELEPVDFLVLEDEMVGRTWELKYRIHARELPTPAEGILFLDVQSDETV